MLTDATVAVNVAVEAPAGTVKLPGTVTALALLLRATLCPLDDAAELKVTAHEVLPDPVNVLFPHESALTVGAIAVPVPLRLTDAVGAVLEMVSCPVTEFAPVGLN